MWFEDNVLHQQHAVDNVQVGIPFIANLPADVDIFVEPMVRMRIDGSPFRVAGMAKPFASTPESILDLRLKNLSLPAFAGYLTQKLPIKVLQGTLSTKVQIHFVQPESGPIIRLGGNVALTGLDIRDASNAPLVALKSGSVVLDNVEPLGKSVMIGPVALDGLSSNLVVKRPGVTNFTPLAAALGGAPASPAAPPSPPLEISGCGRSNSPTVRSSSRIRASVHRRPWRWTVCMSGCGIRDRRKGAAGLDGNAGEGVGGGAVR